jgi:1-acyl-sn-glycerol-3-phosphate acyltransferase
VTLSGAARLAAVIAVGVPLLLVLWPVQLVLVRTQRWARLPRFFWRTLLALAGVRVRVLGEPVQGRPVLIVANHASWLDIAVLSSVLPVAFVAKSEVAGWPVIGALARLQRTIFVDRERRTATGAANREMAARLAAGDALVLFPEGTSSLGTRVLPFRSALLGAVRDALLADADAGRTIAVQPLAILIEGRRGVPIERPDRPRYAWYGDMALAPHLPAALADGVIEVALRFGAPVEAGREEDRKRLAARLKAEVAALLLEGVTGRSRPAAASAIPIAADSR